MQDRRFVPLAFASLLAAAAVAAGCAGGAHATLPDTPQALSPAAAAAVPAKRKVDAGMRLRIPPSKHRHRTGHYISPNTKSLVVGVQLVTATSPWPSLPPQRFDVATPAPCTGSPSAGYTCSFTVKTFAGKNVFTFDTYAVKSPTPADTPLSMLVSGATDVGSGSSLNFALEGVIADILLGVPSPESSIAPATQAIPIGVATTFPLTITPRDASGAMIATDTFATPLTITANPAGAGVKLSLNAQCPNDVSGAAKIVLNCAADLTHVGIVYTGAVTQAAGINVIDSVTIAASPQPSVAPSPAMVALASNVVPYLVIPSTSPVPSYSYSNAVTNPVTGDLLFTLFASGSAKFVDFNPATQTSTITATALQPPDLAYDTNGDLWTTDSGASALHCLTSPSDPGTTMAIADSNGTLTNTSVASDGSGHIWYIGTDPSPEPAAGFISNACVNGSATAQILYGTPGDYTYGIAPAASGIWTVEGYTSETVYALNTQSSPSPTPAATFAPGGGVNDMQSDGAHNMYATLYGPAAGAFGEVPAGGNAVQTLASGVNGSNFDRLAVFDGGASTPQALLSFDSYIGYGAVILSPVSTTSEPIELPIASTGYCQPAAFDKNGGAWIFCSQADGSIYAERAVLTSTWAPLISNYTYNYTPSSAMISIAEAAPANSSPFTITNNTNPSVIAVATPFPNNPAHAIAMTIVGSGSSILTITDKNGRSVNLPVNVALGAGGAHPRPQHRRAGRLGQKPLP